MAESLHIRVHPASEKDRPTLVYLPGLHGDWTLVTSFRAALNGRAHFVEFTYPRTTEWSLEDYAGAIAAALREHGVRSGWLLGESFGSQIVWPLVACAHRPPPAGSGAGSPFQPEGVILAGGFVRHPWTPAVRACARLLDSMPLPCLRAWLGVYAAYARFRHLQAPETKASLQEFLARRTREDLDAAVHRLRLIEQAHLEALATNCPVPVRYLAGLVDPIVPYPWVRRWLGQHCPAYAGGRTLCRADHNVLGTAPRAAAALVLEWITAEKTPGAAPASNRRGSHSGRLVQD